MKFSINTFMKSQVQFCFTHQNVMDELVTSRNNNEAKKTLLTLVFMQPNQNK